MLLPVKARWQKWYRVLAETLYILPMAIIFTARGANAAYYQYTYRLLSDEIFSYLGISGQGGSLLPHFAVDYWYAWIIPLALFGLFLFAASRLRLAPRNPYAKHAANDWAALGVGVLVLWFMVRGGLGAFIKPADATRYCDPKNSVLVNNDGYNILRTLFTPDIEQTHFMSDEEARELFDPEFVYQPAQKADSLIHKPNICLIIVESLGQEFMGCYNKNEEADTRTPFLDSLAQYCTLYQGRSNGKKSVEGITAVTTSIPNLMNIPFTNSPYADDSISGIADYLKRHGYFCAFFHGTYNGVMNFDRTCARTGFDEYLGKNEYEAEGMGKESDYDGVWGIFDEPFLQYTVRRINTYKEPFLAEIFTVSSHHPFTIPEEHKDDFQQGKHPMLAVVEYMDYSLRRFFDEARKQPWFDNTLFIITGDHSGHGLSREYNDYDGWYRIPMMVYNPQHPEGSVSQRIVQQIDILPTLIDALGFDSEERMVCFGNSVLRNPDRGWQVYYGNDFYCLVANNPENPEIHDITILSSDGKTAFGNDSDLRLLKAVVQQYNNRILENRLTTK